MLKMKSINDYINEKLHISKYKEKSLLDGICDFLYQYNEEYKDEIKVIDKWIKDNDVENVVILTTEDDLEGMNYFSDDDHTEELNWYLKEYNDINYIKLIIDGYDMYKSCKMLIKNKTPEYKDKYDWHRIYISEGILSMKSMSSYIFFVNVKYYKKLANTNK